MISIQNVVLPRSLWHGYYYLIINFTYPNFFKFSGVPQQDPVHFSGLLHDLSDPLISQWFLRQVPGLFKLSFFCSIMFERFLPPDIPRIFSYISDVEFLKKNSGHVSQFAEYLLHILYSISYGTPSMLTDFSLCF